MCAPGPSPPKGEREGPTAKQWEGEVARSAGVGCARELVSVRSDPVQCPGGGRLMHHKRRRSRNQRAGCKLCKPWKVNGFRTERSDGERFSDHRRRAGAARELRDLVAR